MCVSGRGKIGESQKNQQCIAPVQGRKWKWLRYGFTLMWIQRNLTEIHGGGEGKKKEVRVGERAKA